MLLSQLLLETPKVSHYAVSVCPVDRLNRRHFALPFRDDGFQIRVTESLHFRGVEVAHFNLHHFRYGGIRIAVQPVTGLARSFIGGLAGLGVGGETGAG